MIEVTIDSLRVNVMTYERMLLLKERTSERYLAIWIGHAEAEAIRIKLQEIPVPRPMTHDLLHSVIETLGASVEHIFVNDLKNDIFFAKIVLRVDGHQLDIDSRPSDALALAVRVKGLGGRPIPIYVDESVMDKVAFSLDKETGKPFDDSGRFAREGKKISDEELKNMGPFRDFIDTIDLDDFDKRKS